MLNGFVFCGVCGQRYTAEHQLPKQKSYYHCNRAGDRIKCMDKYVEISELEKQVQERFNKLQFSPAFVDRIVAKVKALYEKKKKGVAEEVKRLMSTKLNLEKKLETAEEKFLNGTLADDAFTRIKNKIHEQVDNIDDEIHKVERSRNLKTDVIQELLSLIRNIGKTYEKAPFQLKRLYLGLFWDEFIVADRLITEAKKARVIVALEAVGALLSPETQKPTSSGQAFVSSTYLAIEKVQLRTIRGGYRESNPDRELHKLQC